MLGNNYSKGGSKTPTTAAAGTAAAAAPTTTTTPSSASKHRDNARSSQSPMLSSPRRSTLVGSAAVQQKAFVKTLLDWLETDETLQQVMQSVANLRERVWHTSQLLLLQVRAKTTTTHTAASATQQQSLWKHCGYRAARPPCISSSEDTSRFSNFRFQSLKFGCIFQSN